ncbi:BlaI/MecI/CopY family transcriptional regulator [Aquimarina sp. 2201CG14-23]|uniref:BlaI/MecI/CopY family transcriptional regulator n=1 Tax=Aquimarina mycalae TaxID=3040073 RepID=UPI002478033A|nr:BlaI/MecI/CopY family transcriptional regulator [Aquimarina sp. 2201CG14-23]MDH7444638.1 BlaI/MecI/CopY family transcriptional regulator [Aquimarina sp. 2201CG14-23]
MEKLTNKEEEIMQALWKLQKAFAKEVQAELNNTVHYNTVSTIIRNLEEKGYVGYTAYGKTHQYYPIVTKEQYRSSFVSKAMTQYFNDSYKNMVSFFAKEEKITAEELREILNVIEQKK